MGSEPGRGRRDVIPGGTRIAPIEVEAGDASVTVKKVGVRRLIYAHGSLPGAPGADGAPGAGLPTPQHPGDILMSLNGTTWSVVHPITSPRGGWLVNEEGWLLVDVP